MLSTKNIKKCFNGENFQLGQILNFNDKFAVVILLLLALVCFLPGFFTIPPVDREETSYVLLSKQMAESGNFFDIKSKSIPEHKKPIGLYWLQVAAIMLSGIDLPGPIWIYRITSLLGAVFTTLASYWCARAFACTSNSFLASILVTSAILLNYEARLAKYEVLTLFFIIISQGVLARIWMNEKVGRPIGLAITFWVAVSASFLIGGPVGLMVNILTIMSLCLLTGKYRWLTQLQPIVGGSLFLVIVLPWLVTTNYYLDGGFLISSIVRDFFGKVAYGLEVQGPPPLTHVLFLLLTFWPLSAFAILAVPIFVKKWKNSELIFLLSWIVPNWLVFEFIAYKLPVYMLPILPGLAIATVIALFTDELIWKIGRWIGAILLVLLPFALTLAAIAIPNFTYTQSSKIGILLCLSGTIIAIVPAIQILKLIQPLAAVLPTTIVVVLVYTGTLGWSLPSISSLWISTRLNDRILEVTTCSDPTVNIVGYNEPSIEFFTKNSNRLTSVYQIEKKLSKNDCNVLIIEEKKLIEFSELKFTHKYKPVSKAVVWGFNYSVGEFVYLYIFELQN